MTGIALEHGKLFRPDLSRLLPADYLFNPTIVRWDRSLWMIYRRVTRQEGLSLVEWPRTLAMCRVDEDLQPVPDSNVDLSAQIDDAPAARRWHADPRLFLREGGPWLSFHDNHDLYIARLRPNRVGERLSPKRMALADRNRRQRERNWGFFDDGTLKALYTIDPLVVLAVEEGSGQLDCRTLYETQARLPWDIARWGAPHGGSSPVRVGSDWYAFFSSNTPARPGSDRKVYRMGFFGFDAEPPHRIRYMSQHPILEADLIEGPGSFYCDHAVVYPAGAVYDQGRWLVSLGVNDRTLAFMAFDHQRLIAE